MPVKPRKQLVCRWGAHDPRSQPSASSLRASGSLVFSLLKGDMRREHLWVHVPPSRVLRGQCQRFAVLTQVLTFADAPRETAETCGAIRTAYNIRWGTGSLARGPRGHRPQSAPWQNLRRAASWCAGLSRQLRVEVWSLADRSILPRSAPCFSVCGCHPCLRVRPRPVHTQSLCTLLSPSRRG